MVDIGATGRKETMTIQWKRLTYSDSTTTIRFNAVNLITGILVIFS